MSKTLLTYKDLFIGFDNQSIENCVVKDFNLEIKEGGKYAIVGESGSGKSVTMLSTCSLVNGAHFPQGEILYQFDDQPINLLKTDYKTLRKVRGNHISYIFQEPMTALNPLMTCGNQVLEALKIKEKEKVIALFEQVQLPEPERIYNSYPHQISGGQRQRVMIAMAVANDPKILIADEPTTALDASVQNAILKLLTDLCEARNMALIFISHDLNVVKKVAQYVTVMYKGKIVEQGLTKQIFDAPQHEYTKALLAIAPSFSLKGQYLPTLQHILENKNASPGVWSISQADKNEPLFSVDHLEKSFGTKKKTNTVINQISFEVSAGETLGIVGESGCGKSTLAKILVKLHAANNGVLQFKGESIYNVGLAYRRQVQMIFQDPYSSLNPKIKAGDTLIEPMLVHHLYKTRKECKEKAKALLHDVGLNDEFYERYPHEMSGGQRQRLCIARALSVNPEVIICDESVSALDVSVQAQILNLLKQLQIDKGLTYLFISHDLNVVAYMSDRIMVLNKGEIAELADTDKILQQPKDAYTKKLLSYL
jgi:peptide/nickel transport system ATP-binding protein